MQVINFHWEVIYFPHYNLIEDPLLAQALSVKHSPDLFSIYPLYSPDSSLHIIHMILEFAENVKCPPST